MLRMDYQYHMQLSFSEPVSRHHFTLRCFPANNERQKIIKEQIQIDPFYTGGTETDSFGNRYMYGVVEKQHTAFSVNVSGTACIYGDISLPVHGVHTIGMFRYHTALTKMGPELGKIHEKLPDIRRSALLTPENAMLWMDAVYHSIRYVQGVTQVTTTAENAAELGMGVCQDYAHIFLALLREEHVPCRYVVGMMSGEGASHAWVELFDGEKWLGLDPTNNCPVDDRYICISHGRDAKDCSMNLGYYYGSPRQVQEIHVVVEENKDD